jgi:hypothetical protein
MRGFNAPQRSQAEGSEFAIITIAAKLWGMINTVGGVRSTHSALA